ncbi:MAG: hypothetical protein JW720_06525 [Sedimentisphaerales bacterium]|nr:hypothetical protein [Sedimentisphaerales bacterium]
MATHDVDEKRFDEMLKAALRRHSEPVPADFTARMLRKVRQDQAHLILARAVRQERFGLAATILLGIAGIGGALFFPQRIITPLKAVFAGYGGWGARLVDGILDFMVFFNGQRELFVVFAIVLAFAGYCLVDMMIGDRLRML